MTPASTDERLQQYERAFRKAGLPLFSEEFSAGRDIFNRAVPLLGLVFLGEMLGAGQLNWTRWQNVLAIAGALAILLVVSAGLAAFSGFYFAIAMLTDDTYRTEFFEELTSEMKHSFIERAEYLKLRRRAGLTS